MNHPAVVIRPGGKIRTIKPPPLPTASVPRDLFSIRLYTFLRSRVSWWLLASFIFASFCGILGLKQAFRAEYVVQDDARQHVFWMQRFRDPDLFPHDLVADYFQSVAPQGYSALYYLGAKIGINPLLFHKILPIPLGLIATAYCFGLCMEMLPVPAAGLVATILLNQNLWMNDDLVSATPRAFVYPLFLAFLYYLSRRSLLACLVSLALQGLFYPPIVFLSAAILILHPLRWECGRLKLSQDSKYNLFCLTGLVIALLVMVAFALKSSEFGPTITANEARALREFGPSGRVSFFSDDGWLYWITGSRSGILPQGPVLFRPAMLFAGLLLPILRRFPYRFGLVTRVTCSIRLLPQILLVSIGAFFVSHAFLFKLHLPSRYTRHSFQIVMVIAAGMALITILDAMLKWAGQNRKFFQQSLTVGSIALFGAVLASQLIIAKKFPSDLNYVYGRHPALYEFFSCQPKGILIVSLAREVNQLPTFSQRSILVGREYAIPYHKGYYREIRQRMIDLIGAQYSPDLGVAKSFIRKYGVDFWLVDRNAFTPEYLVRNHWMQQFQPDANEAQRRLERGETPALARFIGRCSAFADRRFVVLDAQCILKTRKDEKSPLEDPVHGRPNGSPRASVCP